MATAPKIKISLLDTDTFLQAYELLNESLGSMPAGYNPELYAKIIKFLEDPHVRKKIQACQAARKKNDAEKV